MICSGAVLFSLINGQYTGQTEDGTPVTVVHSGGVWTLTALGTSYTGIALTNPLQITFNSVRIGCGPVNITLSGDLGPCLPSSSSSQQSSSSQSQSQSSASVSSTSDSQSVPTVPGCGTQIPATLHWTATNLAGACAACMPTSGTVTSNNDGTYSIIRGCNTGTEACVSNLILQYGTNPNCATCLTLIGNVVAGAPLSPVSCSLSPFQAVFNIVSVLGGSFTLTFTQ